MDYQYKLDGDVDDVRYNYYKLVEDNLHDAALNAHKRRKDLGEFVFRKNPKPDVFDGVEKIDCRSAFQRDRDKIVWSKSFKRLQNKTQVFPHMASDHFRRRLTHSLEVAALAAALARDLRLNTFAAEAIALGHDLGHTPFGHAGEEALNEELINCLDNITGYEFHDKPDLPQIIKEEDKEIEKEKQFNYWTRILPVPLYGFDHCAFGVEICEFIENRPVLVDENQTYDYGLNITWDVRDGILHHKFDKEDAKTSITPYNTTKRIGQHSSFNKYAESTHGSLEAQCVYFADKLAYLAGDIEDAFDVGIFKKDIMDHKFFEVLNKNAQEIYHKSLPEPKRENLKALRNMIIDLLVRDCVEFSRGKIENLKTIQEVFESNDILIQNSEDILRERNVFYTKHMEETLFKHHNVVLCTIRAKNIVSALFKSYLQNIDLITRETRESTDRVYGEKLNINSKKILHIISARNYLACMSDQYALSRYREIMGINYDNMF